MGARTRSQVSYKVESSSVKVVGAGAQSPLASSEANSPIAKACHSGAVRSSRQSLGQEIPALIV